MSGLHCYLGRPPACSCGWNYLVYLARCPSSASVSNRRRRRRRRRWRPAHWMCLMWTDGQQTACHECCPDLLRQECMEIKCWWRQTGSYRQLLCFVLHNSFGPYNIICLHRFHCSVNSAVTCGLHCPFSHHHSSSDAEDSQNIKISYHVIPSLHYVGVRSAFPVSVELSKSSLTSAEGPVVLVFQPMKRWNSHITHYPDQIIRNVWSHLRSLLLSSLSSAVSPGTTTTPLPGVESSKVTFSLYSQIRLNYKREGWFGY